MASKMKRLLIRAQTIQIVIIVRSKTCYMTRGFWSLDTNKRVSCSYQEYRTAQLFSAAVRESRVEQWTVVVEVNQFGASHVFGVRFS